MTVPVSVDNTDPLTQASLVCRLRLRPPRRQPSPTAGEVELENVSPGVLEIIVHSSPLQYLNLLVTDDSGAPVSKGHYGDLFSPLREPYTLRLLPGEKLTRPVSLLGNVPAARQVPGRYTVRAVFEYRGLRAVSDPFEVVVARSSSLPSHLEAGPLGTEVVVTE